MNAVAVARKEFADTARSRMLWALTALLVVLTAGGLVAFTRVFEGVTATTATHLLSVPMVQVLPLAALVAGYLAIAGERESGSIRVLMGLPTTRRDVVLGKWLGRTAVVAVSVVAAFLAGGVAILALFGDLAAVDLALLTGLTALFALAYVGIAVGISAATATRSRAMAGAISVFAVFAMLWSAVPMGLYFLLKGSLPTATGSVPGWYLLVERINPANAYSAARNFLLTTPEQSFVVSNSGASQGAGQSVGQLVQGSVPFYAENWFGLVILALWILVPVAVGYWRFRGCDLG